MSVGPELEAAIYDELRATVVDLSRARVSVLGESVGLSDHGIVRLSLADVARIAARVSVRMDR